MLEIKQKDATINPHKVLTYVEYRAVSGVYQYIDPPPFHPASLSSPAPKAGGTQSPAVRGWGVNILKDARHWIGLLQYNRSTINPQYWVVIPWIMQVRISH